MSRPQSQDRLAQSLLRDTQYRQEFVARVVADRHVRRKAMTGERAARNPRGLEGALRKFALSYPEATEDYPWGHRALKVKGKSFAFLVAEKDALVLSVKLPKTGYQALALPFVKPTEYVLGKAGWVTARIPPRASAT